MRWDQHDRDLLPETAPSADQLPAPGKRTLTERLATRSVGTRPPMGRFADDDQPAPVQADRGQVAAGDDPFALHQLHETASAGVAGGGQALPHLDQLQVGFGHHDLTDVRAHVGGAAAVAARSIGAAAYATGNDVAFAATPDLRQAAHEAAHVVQQRGGVRLDGGVGRAGDRYEQHADAVADRIVRGASAEELLDTMAHRGPAGGPAVQRLDDEDVTGNVVGLTSVGSSGRLDDRSRRRVWERLAEIDPLVDATRWDTMTPTERDTAWHAAVRRFQDSDAGRAAMAELTTANEATTRDGGLAYEAPLAVEPGATEDAPTAPRAGSARSRRAGFRAGDVLVNDLTAQALANAWPQTVFGRSMSEGQCYAALAAIVAARGLSFHTDRVNVIGVRGYQGGAIHDNDPELTFTSENVYNDTIFIVWIDEAGQRQVYQARGTVDPGGPAHEPAPADDNRFMVAADQAWDFRGYSRARSHKFDRAEYDPGSGGTVERGRLFTEHPELLEHALASNGGGSGRVIYRAPRSGGPGNTAPESATAARGSGSSVETDRTADDTTRLVSAVHSGASGSSSGARVFGDSVGCSVVHGRWFPGFNESLRRAASDTGGSPERIDFTYSLIDPSMFSTTELEALLDPIAPRADAAASGPAVDGDGGLSGDAATVTAHAAAGITGTSVALPHAAPIAASFGHHDVSEVRAHVGGPAAEAADAIGARAYAYGNDVAFATSPDLRQAAHEAAHVVQQRGGVRLDGGVGRAGDRYEQHADAVAERVIRGESAEALLDTMAHRGPSGGPAVQRDGEGLDALTAAVNALEDAADARAVITAIDHLGTTTRDAEYTIAIGGTDHIVAGRHLRALRNRTLTRASRLDTMGARGTGPWDGTSAPLRGQTLQTHTIEAAGARRYVTVGGFRLYLKLYNGDWGIEFDGDRGPLDAAAGRLAARYEADHQPYRAAAARGAVVVHEGGIDSINTYDGLVFTLGMGLTGGRLNRFLSGLAGTPAGAEMSTIPYFAGLRFNGRREIILDVNAHARVIEIMRAHADDVALAAVRDLVDNDGLAPTGDPESAGDALASRVDPELIGVAEYLHHGLPAYAPNPIGDVRRAVDAHPSNRSAQLATVLKLYAQRVAAHPPGARLLGTILTERLPNKVVHYVNAVSARDATFHLDLAAAQAVLPCLAATSPWPHTTTPPSTPHMTHTIDHQECYWDLGPAI